MKTLFGEQINSLDNNKLYENLESGQYTAVSDIELIYSIVGNEETAVRIYESSGRDWSALFRFSISELLKIPGVGKKKAVALVAAMELGRRKIMNEPRQKAVIRCSRDIFDLMYQYLADLNHEEFWITYLNRANKVIYKECLSKGGISETVADIKMIMKTALDKQASGMILAHNHPSGNLKPSRADINLTNRIKEAAKLFDIKVLDHIILADNKYYSFADEGEI